MTTKASPAVVDIPMAGFSNRIINARMEVAQRGTSFLGIGNNDYSLDRWRHNQSGLMTMEHTQYEDAPADTGLRYCLRVYTSIPDPTVNAGDKCHIKYHVEGYNIIGLYGGPITLSFWVKCSETGTYCVALRNSALDLYYIHEYTIDVADTWERKIVTLDFDPGGSWAFDTGYGIQISWVLWHEGANGVAGSWQAGQHVATANQINHTAITDSDWRLTGVELVKGEVPLEVPEVRPYAVEEMLCQRYYQRWGGDAVYHRFANGMMVTTASGQVMRPLSVTMRGVPGVERSTNLAEFCVGLNPVALTSMNVSHITRTELALYVGTAGGHTVGEATILRGNNNTNCWIAVDADY